MKEDYLDDATLSKTFIKLVFNNGSSRQSAKFKLTKTRSELREITTPIQYVMTIMIDDLL
jgi:hypothetical protein